MRITDVLAKKAVNIITERYGNSVHVWLFGSRADDKKLGGDVDIYVETDSGDAIKRIKCKSALTELFDLKVDLIVGVGDKPIHRIAKSTGVCLK